MFRSGGTATTGTAADGMIQMSPSASAQAVSPSAHGKTVAWSPLRSNGTTAAQSRAKSAVATKRHGRTEMAPKPGPFCLRRKDRCRFRKFDPAWVRGARPNAPINEKDHPRPDDYCEPTRLRCLKQSVL